MKKTIKISEKLFMLLVLISFILLSSCGTANNTIKSNVSEDEYDEVLLSGDGYKIVCKWTESLEKSEYYIGVIKDGDWLYNLSNDNILLESQYFDKKTTSVRNTANSKNFHYCNDGMFQIESYYYDVYNNTGFKLSDLDWYLIRQEYLYLNFIDDYTMVSGYKRVDLNSSERIENKDDARLLALKRDGSVVDLGVKGYARKYSGGLCYCNGKFYNLDGNALVDISDLAANYDLLGHKVTHWHDFDTTDDPYFINGKCTIFLRNEGGTVYSMEIDNQGNRQPEKKVEDSSNYIPYSWKIRE